jgi:hypothetical protein
MKMNLSIFLEEKFMSDIEMSDIGAMVDWNRLTLIRAAGGVYDFRNF